MNILEKLASSLNRKDEIPNQELAKEIVLSRNEKAVKELIENLSNKKAIQNDCIKILYEIGEQDPRLISNYINEFVEQLNSKNNRLQWGAMVALDKIVNEKPKEIYVVLPTILNTADKGSVITKDYAINILIKLCTNEDYSDNAFTLLIEQLLKSATNQFPMYAERAIPIVNEKNKTLFLKILTLKLDDIEKETKRKRVEKIIQKLKYQ